MLSRGQLYFFLPSKEKITNSVGLIHHFRWQLMFQYFKVVETPLIPIFKVKKKKNTQETKLEKEENFLITNQVYILLNGHYKLGGTTSKTTSRTSQETSCSAPYPHQFPVLCSSTITSRHIYGEQGPIHTKYHCISLNISHKHTAHAGTGRLQF